MMEPNLAQNKEAVKVSKVTQWRRKVPKSVCVCGGGGHTDRGGGQYFFL